MAHYAEIGPDNIVLRVLVVGNNITHNTPDGTEDENLGAQFLTDIFGGEWVATSYNHSKRGRYAGIGFFYDRERDQFIPPYGTVVDGTWIPPEQEI